MSWLLQLAIAGKLRIALNINSPAASNSGSLGCLIPKRNTSILDCFTGLGPVAVSQGPIGVELYQTANPAMACLNEEGYAGQPTGVS
jgi:hypothetical protein